MGQHIGDALAHGEERSAFTEEHDVRLYCVVHLNDVSLYTKVKQQLRWKYLMLLFFIFFVRLKIFVVVRTLFASKFCKACLKSLFFVT